MNWQLIRFVDAFLDMGFEIQRQVAEILLAMKAKDVWEWMLQRFILILLEMDFGLVVDEIGVEHLLLHQIAAVAVEGLLKELGILIKFLSEDLLLGHMIDSDDRWNFFEKVVAYHQDLYFGHGVVHVIFNHL